MRRLASAVGVAIVLLGLEGCVTKGVYEAWVDSSQYATPDLSAPEEEDPPLPGRNHLWLLLLPPAAVVDVAAVPIWACLFACPYLLPGEGNYEWSP